MSSCVSCDETSVSIAGVSSCTACDAGTVANDDLTVCGKLMAPNIELFISTSGLYFVF